jgi:hypothetical protein
VDTEFSGSADNVVQAQEIHCVHFRPPIPYPEDGKPPDRQDKPASHRAYPPPLPAPGLRPAGLGFPEPVVVLRGGTSLPAQPILVRRGLDDRVMGPWVMCCIKQYPLRTVMM